MDCFSADFLDYYIKRSKLRSIEKLNKLELSEEELPLYSDLLCSTLEYSPKIYIRDLRRVLNKKFSFDKEDEESPIGRMKKLLQASSQNLTFNIERRTSIDELGEKRISHDGSSVKLKLTEIDRRKISQYEKIENIVKSLVLEVIDKATEEKFEMCSVNNKNRPISIVRERRVVSPTKRSSPFRFNNKNLKLLKVYIKQEPEITTIIDIPFYSSFKTLNDVMKFLLQENRIHPKNINLYFFAVHSSKLPSTFNDKNIEFYIKEEEEETEIPFETKLDQLQNLEVDLLMKNYPDLAEFKCISYSSQQIFTNKYASDQSQGINETSFSKKGENIKMNTYFKSNKTEFVPEFHSSSKFYELNFHSAARLHSKPFSR